MTVGEAFLDEKITKEKVDACAEISSYWVTSVDFILAKWDTPLQKLSTKQYEWFTRILEDLIEKRIKGDL